MRICRRFPLPAVVLSVLLLWAACLTIGVLRAGPAPTTDPATSWGSDHVGASLPEYVTGEECLFCHRDNFGNLWSQNAHERTVRAINPDSAESAALNTNAATQPFADQVELVLGGRRQTRFLKRSSEYGKLSLLSVKFAPASVGPKGRKVGGTISETKSVHWDKNTFEKSCAGCHATAVDPRTHAFSALSLECYTCHGIVDLRHSKDTKLVYFGKDRHDAPRVVVSICGQCHLRTGKSRSSTLPYPDNFVAGDNLFRDFHVSLGQADLAAMNPADRHVAQNAREVLQGKTQTSCTTCHDVHRQSAARHRQVAADTTCATCHEPGNYKSRKRYEVHSTLCGY